MSWVNHTEENFFFWLSHTKLKGVAGTQLSEESHAYIEGEEWKEALNSRTNRTPDTGLDLWIDKALLSFLKFRRKQEG